MHQLKDGTRVPQTEMTRFSVQVGCAVRLQLWASCITAELLKQYRQSSNAWEKTSH